MNTYNETMDGGVFTSGDASSNVRYGPAITSAGARGDSAALIAVTYLVLASGGLLGAGNAFNQATYNTSISGGLKADGDAFVFFGLITQGGVISDGSADIAAIYKANTFGGVRGNGTNTAPVLYSIHEISGGVRGNGTAAFGVIIFMQGGIVVDGDSVIGTQIAVRGGSTSGGLAKHTHNLVARMTGGARAKGTVNPDKLRVIGYVGNGEIIMGGVALSSIRHSFFFGTGQVQISGTAEDKLNFVWYKNLGFRWHTRSGIEKELKFIWNTGRLQMFWYRVISEGVYGTGCPLQGDPCCQKFIVNIHARTLTELCEKLSKRKFKFPIQSVQRFSRPAENAVVKQDEENGIDHNCQKLENVEICQIPACADFCVQFDTRQRCAFSTRVQIDAFKLHMMSGEAFIAGEAGVVVVRNLPAFSHTMSGGRAIEGGAEYNTNSFTGRGGAVATGASARSAMSRWKYNAGEWPYTTGQLFGSTSSTQLTNVGEILWGLPERVLRDDSLFAQTDISFGRTSQRLVITGFNLNIPSDARVMGFIVRIDRLATQVGVRDAEVYLARNGLPISDNLAVTNVDWPLIETMRVYGNGNTGLPWDTGSQWRNTNSEDYSGPFTIDEVNDPTFGIIIKVKSNRSLPRTIAKIDYVTLETYYENVEHQIIRVSGEYKVVSPSYHYIGKGRTDLKSKNQYRVGYKYRSKGLSRLGTAEVEPGGCATIGFYNDGKGGAAAGGEALVIPYIDFMTGGSSAGGDAKVTPYFEAFNGGAVLSGKPLMTYHVHVTMDGEIVMIGEAFVPEAKYDYNMSGEVEMGGTARIRKPYWRYETDGNAVFMGGAAGQKASDIGTPVEQMVFSMTVLQTTATFVSDTETRSMAAILTDQIDSCGCLDIPLIVELTHNIAKDNLLAQFLVRNGFTIPRRLKLRYNLPNGSWQCNLHYRGLAADANTQESWDITFELQCTDIIGGIGIGTKIWRLAIQVFRKNIITLEDFETRVIVGVLPEGTCNLSGNQLDFLVTFDTQLKFAIVEPKATVYQSTIFDNIGLFRNRVWVEEPNLSLKVSQIGTANPVERLDLTSVVLG